MDSPEEELLDSEEPVKEALDPAFADKKIVKVRGRTNASAGGKSQKDRTQFASDKKLRDLLATADEITSLEHFMYWKDEFLHSFRDYLDPEETANAREADETLYLRMQKLAKQCLKVKQLLDEGSISVEGSSVSGQKAINEFIAQAVKAEKQLHEYFPKTKEDEMNVKYNKFSLSAILVRDGFRVYELMITTRDYIINLRDGALKGDILKPNHKSILQFYLKEIDTFCDTLADLGMFKLMNKCVELYKIRPRKKKKKKFNRETMDPLSDSSDDENINNGRMFRRSKVNFRSIMDRGWTSGITGAEVHNPHIEEAEDPANSTPKKEVEEEDKPDPLKPEEWIYYYDPNTDVVGKIPRKQALGENFIIRYDEDMKEHQDFSVKTWDTKDGVVGKEELIWKLKDACKGKGKKKKKTTPGH